MSELERTDKTLSPDAEDKNLSKPLASWAALTVAYGLAIYAFNDYEVPSLIYHAGLLVLTLYFARGINGLSLRIGNFRYGVLVCVGFFGGMILRLLLWGMPKFAFALDLATFSLLLFSPITEELFWRGLVMQRILKHSQIDVLVGSIVNGGLFALMHLPKILFLNQGAITLLPIFGLGIVFSLIYYLGKSVYYSTVAHIIQNIFAS